MTYTPETLVAFRDRVAQAFRDKRIRSPVHFPGGNEAQVIEAFRDFRPGVDYLCSGWRNMYHCLLAGMPEEELFDTILAGRSMYIMSEKHRILCSSIVGGMLPTACGLAMGIKRRQEDKDGFCRTCRWPADRPDKCRCPKERVWVCVGDMTARTGLFHEFREYAAGHLLPVVIIVENNGLSTNAPTEETWGTQSVSGRAWIEMKYDYTRTMPHVGLQERVSF